MIKRLVVAGIAGTLLGGAFTVAAPSAQALAQDGSCQAGEFCVFYNSNQQGSVSDFTASVGDYGSTQTCYKFKGTGAGQGLCVKNNAASIWNRTFGSVSVHYNSGYTGASQTVAPGAKVNLSATLKNENASHKFGRAYLSVGLYKAYGGRITTGFDGYKTTPGKHEGIDIAKGIGSPVRALVEGKVINVAPGARGRTSSANLSTVAIYNATYDRTIIYLHSAPLSILAVGQNISKGQQIATEDWRGVSTSGGAHTHVEMRLGSQRSAAKSVDDPVLTNPNPTAFWNARGYDVR
jgi:murein DD-endopeptidase MepM/ murein hydrolase activator NlpD